jgi:superfamily II DNA or RNA helicase
MAARAIDALAQPCVYIAPSVQIVRQTYEVFCSHFGDHLVARLDGDARPDQRDISKLIVVATSPSAVKQTPEWWATRKMLILDEFHHSAAETYHRINELAANAYYRLAFTGTHFRSGADGLAMQAVCSQVLHSIPIPYLVERGFLAPPRVVSVPVRTKGIHELSWEDAYQEGIVECDERNAIIVKLVEGLASNGIPTIVLAKRRMHADLLGDRIAESVVVKGGEGILTSSAVKAFCDGRGYVLIGTSVIGEGVDVPRAAALVYASAGDASVQMMQSYFRPLTAQPGKSVGLIYDFDDRHHGTLRKHSASRRSFVESYVGTRVVSL